MAARDVAISEEEATAYCILRQCGWTVVRTARAFRRCPQAVAAALERRARELRIAREIRSPYEVHPYDGADELREPQRI